LEQWPGYRETPEVLDETNRKMQERFQAAKTASNRSPPGKGTAHLHRRRIGEQRVYDVPMYITLNMSRAQLPRSRAFLQTKSRDA
jgi:hypothetical protein